MKTKSSSPTIYLDTSVLSSLHYKGGSFQGLYRAIKTREWWDHERRYFTVYTAKVTELELRQGRYGAQEAAIAEAKRLPYLPLTKHVRDLAQAYISAGLVPLTKRADALHLAFSTVYMVDYLLTWNCAHMANPQVQTCLQEINSRLGCRTPWLVSPDTIPKVAYGQVLRRRD